jgi:LmbE family N-acetylglucosaminyl deacetylase
MAEFPQRAASMPEWLTRGDYAVVVAHPDDEVLWFGSVLEKARRTVLCYGDYELKPEFGPGRRAVDAEYPLSNACFLHLMEPDSYAEADWSAAEPTATGLSLTSPEAQRRLDANFRVLVSRIEPLLRDVAYVFTHNPWGEYGHEDHVQVSAAVREAARRRGCRVLSPLHFAPRSIPLMLKTLSLIGRKGYSLRVDPVRGEEIKQLYIRHKCWTWFPNWSAPPENRFFMLRGGGEEDGCPAELPMNFLNH